MKKSTAIAFGIIVGVAVLLLGLGQCGYNKLEEYQTLENVTAAVRQDFPNVEHITPNVLALLSQSESAPLLVDVREPEEYAVSRIPGAIRLPDAEAIQNHIGTLEEKPESIVVYCSVGRRSAAVAEGLEESSGIPVRNLVGSIFAWANEDRPLETPTGEATDLVHPFNNFWGRLLDPERRYQPEDPD